MGESARDVLVAELREHALVIGDVTLSSGRTASYYVDAKRALLRPAAFRAVGELVAERARELGATAVGGMTMGADPIACAALAAPGGEGLVAFFVRKQRKEHGLERWVEGPVLEPGTPCLVVEDVVTTGGSTVRAVERVLARGPRRARGACASSTGSPAAARRSRQRAARRFGADDDRRDLPRAPGPRLTRRSTQSGAVRRAASAA